MIDIQWKGKIGYGDIVSPICYAHNLSHFLKEKVNLTFRWDHDEFKKIADSDPETLAERADYLASIVDVRDTDVVVSHSFNDPLDINHTNYDWNVVGRDPYHNYWRANAGHSNTPTTKLIVVNSTRFNQQSLKQYGKSWKDPVAEQWEYLVDEMKYIRGFDVVEVNYTTPIAQLTEMLRYAQLFIGYHGTAAWVARYIGTPTVMFSEQPGFTSSSFPNAFVMKNLEQQHFLDNIDEFQQWAQDKNDACMLDFEEYKTPQATIDHLTLT